MPRTRATKSARGARGRARRRRRKPAAGPRAVEAALAAFAHDVRTSLTGILALGELLATSNLGERERRWAADVKTTAEHLAALTTLAVDGAKAGATGVTLRRDAFRPGRLVDTVGAALSARAEAKGLDALVEIGGDVPERVIGDSVRLRAALDNLVDNAVKFTERGIVRLAADAAAGPRGRVMLTFTIADSGIGLTASEIKRLFRPFVQANTDIARRYGGAGLGLAFVKRLARAMGGDLTVTSRPGHGSTFRLTALVEPASPDSPAENGYPSAAGSPPARSLSILCAEDNPYGRVVLNTILTELGHRVDFVGSGDAAVESVSRGEYDAVLMDVALNGMDGIAATRQIRALPPPLGRVPILGVSGRTRAADDAAARAAGMDDYLHKPLSPSALSQALGVLTTRE
jgi:CheY-like chemotaxis protein/nitrogen-specific signal transduction histidine kinase